MKVVRILHASVNVAGSLEKTSRFYGDVLGMSEARRPEIPGVEGQWLTAGPSQVHLVDAPMAGSGIDPSGPHYCLAVEDLDEAVAELEDRDIPYLRASQPAGPDWQDEVVQIWFTDPAGNTIELQQDHQL